MRGVCSTVSTGSAEIHSTVVQRQIRNGEARLLTAKSVEVEFSFRVILEIHKFDIQKPQELQISVFVLFVPEDAIVIRYFVWTFDPTGNRFTVSFNDVRRCLEDTFGVGGTCGKEQMLFTYKKKENFELHIVLRCHKYSQLFPGRWRQQNIKTRSIIVKKFKRESLSAPFSSRGTSLLQHNKQGRCQLSSSQLYNTCKSRKWKDSTVSFAEVCLPLQESVGED